MKPKVCILRTDGTNCDEETFYAFEKFGGVCEYVHINELRKNTKLLKQFQILVLPGGFANGDDVASGKILAVELIHFLKSQLQEFIAKGGLILGICNGFQVLVRTGLLPFGKFGKMDVTLTQNDSGHFECRFIKIKIERSKVKFLEPYAGQIIDIAVNHGEGKFFSSSNVIRKIENDNLVVCRYVDDKGAPTQNYPQNPNGSLNAIAGVSDPTGRILGLMPHPEKFVDITQHPNWRRLKLSDNFQAQGNFIFKGIINYAKSF
ncbi:phosphoribosylformylglycinamidine synthase I [Candidatus Curtissbacteria bacterium RBG_13_40_7]|uniref:Phosphoribosylformylglycinamidine synthase I n=1 Tax=Candidatus Curtissbacteria bacterium RBG_13_40_7 TaxID=1797706 RepID=A0A1F5FUX2_9BACT|nr:MAG: phosphoribosylformylglycinamidine synthase I [Candidatus Curtissbacteria bacterium RBG_13_40_7]